MKKLMTLGLSLFVLAQTTTAYAEMGDIGYFGGVSEGKRLPKTTELLLKNTSNRRETSSPMVYKEVTFLSGTPSVMEGTIEVTKGTVNDKNEAGTYNDVYEVEAANGEDSIARDLTLKTNYRIISGTTQIIKDSEADDWSEAITVGGTTYTLNEDASYFSKSIIEDHKPGVTYYKGNLSTRSVYESGDEGKITVQVSGDIYGYDSAWSATETQRLNVSVFNEIGDQWQLQAQLRPSFSVNKTLQYSQNEPTAISFEGNYYEVLRNQSGMSYDVFIMPPQFESSVPRQNSFGVDTYNAFEQLVVPEMAHLKGHFAESDIKKLFSMQVLTGDPVFYKPEQSMTRAQYVAALIRAIKLPIEEDTKSKSKTKEIVFPDMPPTRSEYPYIMAAYKAKITVGKQNGHFMPDEPIDRQEAFVILLRTLGLESLGITSYGQTMFTDDKQIDNWARKEINAAARIGLIRGDEDGNLRPKSKISKAEGAALVNNLINYLRTGIQQDYVENIVNFSN